MRSRRGVAIAERKGESARIYLARARMRALHRVLYFIHIVYIYFFL